MSESFMGEIRMVGFKFAPVGWALCNGQLLPISQNEALFNLIGTTYGGDGHSTFALPNLQSRVPMHPGNGHALSEMGGAEQVSLTVSQLPTHIHLPQADQYYGGTSSDPTGNLWAMSEASKQYVDGLQPNAPMSQAAMALTGGGQQHDNMLPYQAVNFIIALSGLYPSQG
jgi:microcystin-dependent protein